MLTASRCYGTLGEVSTIAIRIKGLVLSGMAYLLCYFFHA